MENVKIKIIEFFNECELLTKEFGSTTSENEQKSIVLSGSIITKILENDPSVREDLLPNEIFEIAFALGAIGGLKNIEYLLKKYDLIKIRDHIDSMVEAHRRTTNG